MRTVRIMVPGAAGWGYYNGINLEDFKEENGITQKNSDERDLGTIGDHSVKEFDIYDAK